METRVVLASHSQNDERHSNTSEQYRELAGAIVLMAVNDYIKAIRGMWKIDSTSQKKRELILKKLELEDFFHSAWYTTLCDYDSDKVIESCHRRAREQEEAAIRRKNRKQIKELEKQKKSDKGGSL